MSGEPVVSAEVILRERARGERASAESVADRLNGLGLQVLSAGGGSVSVQSTKARFESVFECRLVPLEESSPGEDFGPLGGAGFRAEKEPRVPPELREEVESVEIQPPPLMFRGSSPKG